jgi:hypothetical protein
VNLWEEAILRSVDAAGGSASNREIYGRVGKFISLSSEHLRPTQWGGRPAYEHQVRSHLSNLCGKGGLVRMGRGQYRLTPAGRARIRN